MQYQPASAVPDILGGGVPEFNIGYTPPTPAAGMSTLGTVASAAAALYGTYQLASNWGKMSRTQGAMSGAIAGAGIGSFVPGVGTAVGAAAGAVVGLLSSFVHTGKHEDQLRRDGVRDFLKKNGMITADNKLQLADINVDGQPEFFDIGLDGGARQGYDFSGGRRPYEVRTEHPFSVQAVGWANPLAVVLTGGDAKLTSDFAGYFANASMSNTDDIEGVRANILQIMKNMKLTRQSAESTLQQLLSDGKIDEPHYQAYMISLDTLFKGDSKQYVTTPWGEFEEQVAQGKEQAGVEGGEAQIADPAGRGDFHATADQTASELSQSASTPDTVGAQAAAYSKQLRDEQAAAAKRANRMSVASELASSSAPNLSQISSLQAMGQPQMGAAQDVGTDAARAAIEGAKQRAAQFGPGRYYN